MKILLASANLHEIHWASKSGLLDGVITTPTLLAGEGSASERDLVAEICLTSGTPVYVTVHAVGNQDIYRDARELAKVSDQVVVQVPLVEDSVEAIRRLCLEGVRVAAMLVFNAAQALLAAKAGANSVITPVDHLDAVGHSGIDVVRELRAVFNASATECEIIAVRPATATQFAACALAGADAVAVSPDVLRNLLVHPLTDRGIDQFLNDLSKQRASWASV
jgi:transaldolase